MTIIEAIADLIEAGGITELAGSERRVYVYEMPDDLNYGVLVLPVLGSFATRKDTPGYYSGEFMVVIRHNSIEQAMNLAKLVSPTVDVAGVQTADFDIKLCYPASLPFPFPRSAGDKYEAMVQGAIYFAEK